MDRKMWEVGLQEVIGLNHVLYHSAQHGSLHIAVFIKRDLIWFCSTPEDGAVSVRMYTPLRTKGAVAVSFTLFGTSLCFIGSHFQASEGNEKARTLDYKMVNESLKLPQAIVINPLQKSHKEMSNRFDCVFWAGDFNFRITKNRERVINMINAKQHHEHPHFENLLDNDELTLAMNNDEIFQSYQEGRVTFPPTYKFDRGELYLKSVSLLYSTQSTYDLSLKDTVEEDLIATV